nr:hypothetical protein CFP56_54051 [Quercus suber]
MDLLFQWKKLLPVPIQFLCPCGTTIGWLDWVEQEVADQILRNAKIFEAIVVSRGWNICRDMRALRFLVRRWNPDTHTFFFPWGETIVTLEDVERICLLLSMGDVNLRELGLSNKESAIAGKLLETFGGTFTSSTSNRAMFSFWIFEFKEFEDVDTRRAAFLALWLSKCVFNSDLVQFIKPFTFPLAVVLNRGVSLPLGTLCLGTLYFELDRLHSNELGGSPYHIIESSVNVVLFQTFIWEHSKDYIDVGKDVGNVKMANWVVQATGPNGELQFLGFEDGLPLLMKWMGSKVWILPLITLLDDGAHFAWKPYSYVAARFCCPNPFPSARPGSQEFGLADHEMVPNFLLITSPSHIPYPSGAGFDLTKYNPHRVLRQFGFDQDVLDVNATGCRLSDALRPLVHSIALEYWASKVKRVLVPSRHCEGYATSNMKLYWRKVMTSFVDYRADLMAGWFMGGIVPLEWSEKNVIVRAPKSNPATSAPKRSRDKSPLTVTNVGSPMSTYKSIMKAPRGLKILVIPNVLPFDSVGQKISFKPKKVRRRRASAKKPKYGSPKPPAIVQSGFGVAPATKSNVPATASSSTPLPLKQYRRKTSAGRE